MRTRTYRSRGLPDWPQRVLLGMTFFLAILVALLIGWGLTYLGTHR